MEDKFLTDPGAIKGFPDFNKQGKTAGAAATAKSPKINKPPENNKKTVSKPAQHSKDLEIIMQRNKLFKEAALEAKKNGNVKLALTYLKQAKVMCLYYF